MWLYGTQKEVEVTENGNETWLSADELIADRNEHADIIPDNDGRVWVYYYDQQIDITDRFDDDGICRIALSHDGNTVYLKVTSESDGSMPSPSSMNRKRRKNCTRLFPKSSRKNFHCSPRNTLAANFLIWTCAPCKRQKFCRLHNL